MKLQKLRSVYSGVVIYPMADVSAAQDTLARWAAAFKVDTVDMLTTSAKIGCDAEGQPMILFSFCYAGSDVRWTSERSVAFWRLLTLLMTHRRTPRPSSNLLCLLCP